MTLVETNASPIGLKEGVNFQSAAAKTMRPREMANALAYSMDLKMRRLMIVAMSIVGISLLDRNTAFVGKLM